MRFILLVLATFWLWATVRYPLQNYASAVFDYSRPVHPLLVVAVPLYVLWPDWVTAMAVAGATGLLVATTDRLFGVSAVTPIQVPRRGNRRGLPRVP